MPQAMTSAPKSVSYDDPSLGGWTCPSKARAFLYAFLKHCISGTNAVTGGRGTRLGFISFHSKGAGSEVFSPIKKHTPTIGRLVENVAAGLTIAASFPELRGREVIVSECDPDEWAAGSMHDSPNLEYRNTDVVPSDNT